ncbi:anti-sigma F factor antagonist [Turicibacter sanguinis]|uniref:anti-sigma F factor antagonist n=1 Tax=Turicibacter sanguinis TaxID=154288 RepID=UPI0011C73439|nr:anti-sigma F factor antagonist [Turicibacter sanguinis]
MSITVSLYVEGQVLYVNLNGELDHHTADQLRSRLNSVMSESRIQHIVFNLKHLDFMDSSGIGIILGRYNQLKSVNGTVMVIGMKPLVKKVFELSGLSQIIKVVENEKQITAIIRGIA